MLCPAWLAQVLSTVRNVMLVAHSALFLGEAVTRRELSGYAVGFNR